MTLTSLLSEAYDSVMIVEPSPLMGDGCQYCKANLDFARTYGCRVIVGRREPPHFTEHIIAVEMKPLPEQGVKL